MHTFFKMCISLSATVLLLLNSGCSAFKFLALGDWGTPEFRSDLAAVFDSRGENVSLALLLGDNFYSSGVSSPTDEQFETTYQASFAGNNLRNTTFLILLGNHDYYGNEDAQIAYSDRTKRWTLPNYYYSKHVEQDGIKVHFVMLDTWRIVGGESASQTESKDEEQVNWLRSELNSTESREADWRIVCGHYPIYTAALRGNYEALGAHVLPILEEYGVDAYIYAHDHMQQVIRKGNSALYHYGSGSGGKKDAVLRGDELDGLIWKQTASLSFMQHELTKTNMVTTMIGSDNQELYSIEQKQRDHLGDEPAKTSIPTSPPTSTSSATSSPTSTSSATSSSSTWWSLCTLLLPMGLYYFVT